MRTDTPLENAQAEAKSPKGIEQAEKTRIEANRTAERDDSDVRLEGEIGPARRDDEFAPVEAARRTTDADRRV